MYLFDCAWSNCGTWDPFSCGMRAVCGMWDLVP